MIIDERTSRKETLIECARQIMTAGRTAPKGKGIDLIEIVTITDEKIEALSQTMQRIAQETEMHFFQRDAENILQAEAVLLVGARIKEMALNCGYCGFPTCAEKHNHPEAPCAINMVDLGIAIGSMTAKAADLRIDCRVMYSAGMAAKRMNLIPDCHSIYAIPISASSKNPFFDRQPKQ